MDLPDLEGILVPMNYTLELIFPKIEDTTIIAETNDCNHSKPMPNRHHVSIMQRWPSEAIKKKDSITISLAIIPSFVDGRALGKARRKS